MRDRKGRPRCSTFELGHCSLAPAQIGGFFFSEHCRRRQYQGARSPDCRPAIPASARRWRANQKRPRLSFRGKGRDGRLGPGLAGKRKSRLGDCSVNAHLGGRVPTERLPGSCQATREPQSATTTGETHRQRRTFHLRSSSPCAVAVTHSSGSQSHNAAPVRTSCLYGT